MIARRRLSTGIRAFLALLLTCLAGFPLFWIINTAMTPTTDLFQGQQKIVPDFSRTLEVFSVLTTDTPFLAWMANSAFVAFGTTLLSLLLATMAAYALSRYKFVGKGPMGFLFFATQMLPEALLVVPLYSLFAALGLLNQLSGLVLVNTAFAMPVALFILKSAIDNVPYELEESARVDGCTQGQAFRKVIMPLAAPAIFTTAILAFISSWNEFLIASQLSSDATQPVTVAIASFAGAQPNQIPYTAIMAAGTIVTIPLVILVLVFQRKIVAGLTAGAVK
jgi:multiple sugar transport system permease protein